MNPIIHTAGGPVDLANHFAQQLVSWVKESGNGPFHLALSGGKTPSLLYSLLAVEYVEKIDWQKIHFWWGDERMVPAADPESNFGIANQILLSWLDLSQNQIHRIRGDADPVAEAKRYGSEIKQLVPVSNHWPRFDLVILGLGDDGHTASIFPDQSDLLESDEIAAVAFHPVSRQARITLTGKVLNNAKRVAFLVSGASKSEIFDKVTRYADSAMAFPAAHIRPAGELHWFVDFAN